MALDDRSQKRLAALAEREGGALDARSRERVLAGLRSVGPQVVHRARVVRATKQVGAGLGAVLAIAGASLWLARSPAEQPAPLVASACESFGDVTLNDLGPRAEVFPSVDAELRLIEGSGCKTRFSLLRGEVVVHAKDLGGGELSVETPHGRVTVHGTIFRVASSEDEVVVDVIEGKVELSSADRAPEMLTAGQRSRRGKKSAVYFAEPETIVEEIGPDPEKKARKPRRKIALAPEETKAEIPLPEGPLPETRLPPGTTPPISTPPAVKPKPPPSPTEDATTLVRRADVYRRSGDLDGARKAYQAAGTQSGPDAEAAWIALARLELRADNIDQAKEALVQRARRFGAGLLGVEGAWLAVEIEEADGDLEAAAKAARSLIARWPKTAQADAAQRWLDRAARDK